MRGAVSRCRHARYGPVAEREPPQPYPWCHDASSFGAPIRFLDSPPSVESLPGRQHCQIGNCRPGTRPAQEAAHQHAAPAGALLARIYR